MPYLQALQDQYKEKVQIIGVCEPPVNIDEIQRLREQLGVRYPLLLDREQKIGKLYSIETVPYSVFIDKQQRVQYVKLGFSASEKNIIRERLEIYLK
jgi:peroxiredoxin